VLGAAVLTAVLARGLLGDAPDDGTSAVRPTLDAGGTRGDGYALWALDRAGAPLRWDACTPIGVVLSTVEAPDGAEDDLREALTRLSDASGLRLELRGTTDERPSADRALVVDTAAGWAWAPVLVGWVAPDAALGLTPLDRGIALPVAVRDGDREAFVTGQVALNARRTDLVPGFGDRSDAWGATLLHELVHLVGLDHVDDPSQLMSTDPGSGPVVFGAGDLAGLARVGAAAGCTAAPDAAAGRLLTRAAG